MIDQLINKHKVLVCAGSGGVGKTTMSAAIATRAAVMGKKVLVLTIDPAKRLATALGLESLPSEEVKVPGQNFKGELWAGIVDSKKVFDEFVIKNAGARDAGEKIIKNRLYNQLSTTLSGSQEYTAMERLYQAVLSNKYDLIILDTPPAQHAVEFLKAPQKLYALFQSSIMKWFMPKDVSSGLRGLLDRSTKIVFQSLESLTGSHFLEELREFFSVIQSLQPVIQAHTAEIHRILTGAGTTFVVVTSFDEIKLKEAIQFQKLLLTTGYTLDMVIINRSFPEWNQSPNESISELNNQEFESIKKYYLDLREYFSKHTAAFKKFKKECEKDFRVLTVPDFDQEIHDLQSVTMISEELVKRGAE